MKTITEEQFKQQYGQRESLKLEQLDNTRLNKPEASGVPLVNRFTKAIGLGGATDVFGKLISRSGMVGQNAGQRRVSELTGMSQEEINKANIEAPTGKEIAGAFLQTAAIPAGFALTGGSSVAGQAAVGAGLGYAYDVGQDLIEGKSTKDILTPGLGTVAGAAIPPVLRGAGALVGAGKNALTSGVNAVADAIPENIPGAKIAQGVKQKATELVERVPRFFGRVSDAAQEQTLKAERIKNATPAVANALKVDLPESLVQTVPKANPVTRQAFKEVLDIADTPKTTLGQKTNPSIVGGNYAVKQYDAIENQRKTIGKAIGEATKRLPKTSTVNMRPAYDQLDNLLADQGIVKVIDEKGFKLDFSKSNLAPKQRQVVKDLYSLATEAGDTLSPFEVHKKDQLFSAIQREAKADQIADVIIEFGDGQKTDLFRAFRDVYSNQLDTLGPEIKELNKKYRNVATLIDDIENSIFKTPDFEVTKNTDPAEFAKVNLRRIFGEAQSSPAYEAIADEMDAISRQLGYDGPTPKEIAAFAQEIRALYPETIPKTGFQGLSKSAFDIAADILGAGKADTRDQQKALRALVEATEQSSK
jgi:hypothetical protein